MSISERIEELLLFLKMNQKEFAEDIHFSRQSLNNVVNGNTKFPKVDLIYAILIKYRNLNARWLITGEGEMWLSEDDEKRALNKQLILSHELVREAKKIMEEVLEKYPEDIDSDKQ